MKKLKAFTIDMHFRFLQLDLVGFNRTEVPLRCKFELLHNEMHFLRRSDYFIFYAHQHVKLNYITDFSLGVSVIFHHHQAII
jgi:hypothetical protein